MVGRWLAVLGTVLLLATGAWAKSCPAWPDEKPVALMVFLNGPLGRTRFYHAPGRPSIRQAVCTIAPDTYCIAFVDTTKPHVFSAVTYYRNSNLTISTGGEVWLQPGHIYTMHPPGQGPSNPLLDHGVYHRDRELADVVRHLTFGKLHGAGFCKVPVL